MRARIGLAAATAAICAASAALPGAAQAGTLDQQQTTSSYGAGVGESQSIAQVFRAGISGKLDQIDLLLNWVAPTTHPVSVEIRGLSSGSPGAAVLASASIPAASIGPTAGFMPVKFASPPTAAAGTQYAIVLYSAEPSNEYAWGTTTADVYSGGDSFNTTTSPPTAWIDDAGQDMAFKTYVVPPSTPTGQRAAALKKCKKRHSARARRKCRKRANLLPL